MNDPITGVAIIDLFLGMLGEWGYLIVLGFTFLENIFIVGSMTPGETIVMAAAFVASQGRLTLAAVWFASVAGTVAGSNVSYWIGRRGGREALMRYGHRFRIPEERIAASEAYFHRYGSKTIFFGRFAAGFKNFVPMIAGVSRMGLAWFELYTVLGAVAYTTVICAIGYFIGENFDEALELLSGIGYVGMALVIAAAVIILNVRRKRVVRKREELLTGQFEAVGGVEVGPADDEGGSDARE